MSESGRDCLAGALAACVDKGAAAARELVWLAGFVAASRAQGDLAVEFAHLEAAAVLRISPRYAQERLGFAETLVTRFPGTLEALREGRIDEFQAHRIVTVAEVLTDEQIAQIEAALLPDVHRWSLAQLNYRLHRAVSYADPDAAAKRAEARHEARQVRHQPLADGAGLLQIYGDGERTQLAHQRIQTIAREVKATSDDGRTVDQIAADVALDLLAGKDFQHTKIHVWLTIPATTALGVDQKPGHLAGFGWLPAQRALELAAQQDATWKRVLTDPATGHAVDVGRRNYRPPAALTDHLRTRYPTCVGPGCRQPAHRCDRDHVVPFPAGPTSSENVRPLCRPHHRAKTLGGWRLHTTHGLGLMWITKNGFRIPYEPEPIADPDLPPVRAG